MANPGFSSGGAPTPKIAIIFQILAENCMKMKEFGPPGGGGGRANEFCLSMQNIVTRHVYMMCMYISNIARESFSARYLHNKTVSY